MTIPYELWLLLWLLLALAVVIGLSLMAIVICLIVWWCRKKPEREAVKENERLTQLLKDARDAFGEIVNGNSLSAARSIASATVNHIDKEIDL